MWWRREAKDKWDTYISHILWQKILESLAHRIAFSHDALSAVITSTWRVGHEGSTTDDALEALLQRGAEAFLTKCQGVHDDLFLQKEEQNGNYNCRKNSAQVIVLFWSLALQTLREKSSWQEEVLVTDPPTNVVGKMCLAIFDVMKI